MIHNAEITGTCLGPEGHGIPSWMLSLEYDGVGAGFGNYDLRHYGIDPIFKIIKTVGVDSWEQLRGQVIRVEVVNDGSASARIIRIGHITKNDWYGVDDE